MVERFAGDQVRHVFALCSEAIIDKGYPTFAGQKPPQNRLIESIALLTFAALSFTLAAITTVATTAATTTKTFKKILRETVQIADVTLLGKYYDNGECPVSPLLGKPVSVFHLQTTVLDKGA